MTPKVSIIFPTHNRLAWLKESYESLRNQDVDKEILILANGCTDETEKYLDRVAMEDHFSTKMSHYVYAENLRGRYRFLAEKAVGEYLVLWADDDHMLPGNLEKKIAVLEENPELSMVFGPAQMMDRWGVWKGLGTMGLISDKPVMTDALHFDQLIRGDYIPTGTAVVRRKDFLPFLNLLDEQLLPLCDWAFWLAAADSGLDGAYIPEPLVVLRQHDTSDTAHYTHTQRYPADHLAIWNYWQQRGFRPTQDQYLDIQNVLAAVATKCQMDLLPSLMGLADIFPVRTLAGVGK